MARTRTKSQQRKLQYRSALDDVSEIPAWIDGVLKKAVHPDPYKRYEALSEFVHDLRHPNADFVNAAVGAADRAQSAVVLEGAVGGAGAGRGGVAGDAAGRAVDRARQLR